MPKVKISEYSTTNTDNSDIEGINIAEGCAPSGINNAIRELMVHLKEFQTGASGDPLTVAGTFVASSSATINGTTIPASKTLVDTNSSQTLTNKSISGSANTITNVSLTTAVTGTLPIANGGSGATTFADGSIIKVSSGVMAAATAGTDYGKPNTASTWTASQRGTVTTDNDGSFDMNVTNNFSCTPTGNITLTFTNITAGQSGFILLDNTSNYTVSAAATTKVSSTALSTLSATGVYLISYWSNGTNVYIVNSAALS